MGDDALASPPAWHCHVCGRLLPDHLIQVQSIDVSEELGLAPGTAHHNVRYCADRPACATQAPHIRFFRTSRT